MWFELFSNDLHHVLIAKILTNNVFSAYDRGTNRSTLAKKVPKSFNK